MKIIKTFVFVMLCILVFAGCGTLDDAGSPIETDNQISEDVNQTDTKENTLTESVSGELRTVSDVVDENTITFDGVIIDNTIDTLVPTISVKPLLDEIPYDVVFFELPDNEVEWVSQINSVVTITCTDAITEQIPHYGTLISIIGATTETDHSLISFTEEQIGEAKQAALAYYDDTIFDVNSIEYFGGDLPYGGSEDCCNFTVNVSKDGVVQEPDRTISLKLDNGIWKVVNEGY